jgi:hypothetical protein
MLTNFDDVNPVIFVVATLDVGWSNPLQFSRTDYHSNSAPTKKFLPTVVHSTFTYLTKKTLVETRVG